MRAGDDSAYEELFRRHAEAVRRYARTCCRDAHTADDLTAEVFARTLQAVRGGAGPEHAVRAYLLTTVRRVAAAWTKTAKREQLVEDFAVFAAQAVARLRGVADADDTLDLGADVRAMHEAEQSLAMQAFRSLPERWQAVLWHTTVEEESPSEVAPLFGLTANATAVLASRAREGLKQAYLQAHVSPRSTAGGDCARYADRLGAYARGGLRMRAERGLRKHLEECAKCRLAAGELKESTAGSRRCLPVAVIGWFAAGYAKAAGLVAGGAGRARRARVRRPRRAGRSSGGAGGGRGGLGGARRAGEGRDRGGGGRAAAAAAVVFALAGDDVEPESRWPSRPPRSRPPEARAEPEPATPPEPSPRRRPPAPVRRRRPGRRRHRRPPRRRPEHRLRPPKPHARSRTRRRPRRPHPRRPTPTPTPTPTPPPPPPPAPAVYQVERAGVRRPRRPHRARDAARREQLGLAAVRACRSPARGTGTG